MIYLVTLTSLRSLFQYALYTHSIYPPQPHTPVPVLTQKLISIIGRFHTVDCQSST